MLFVCPKCERPLIKANGWHYCQKVSVADLLKEKPARLVAVFHKLLREVGSWPDVSASATKTCVVFITAKSFLVVKVMKQELDLKFILPEETDEFPIYKKQAYGKKLEHYIRLRDEEDLDGDAVRLLRKAYDVMQH